MLWISLFSSVEWGLMLGRKVRIIQKKGNNINKMKETSELNQKKIFRWFVKSDINKKIDGVATKIVMDHC